MRKLLFMIALVYALLLPAVAQRKFNGIGASMGNIYRLPDAVGRSISPEIFIAKR